MKNWVHGSGREEAEIQNPFLVGKTSNLLHSLLHQPEILRHLFFLLLLFLPSKKREKEKGEEKEKKKEKKKGEKKRFEKKKRHEEKKEKKNEKKQSEKQKEKERKKKKKE